MWELCKNQEARFLFFSLEVDDISCFPLPRNLQREKAGIFPGGRGQIEGRKTVQPGSVPMTLFVCLDSRLVSLGHEDFDVNVKAASSFCDVIL